MMPEHEDFYTPENIDEQVDMLLQAHTMPDQDQRMAYDLHMVLTKADADKDTHSLQRVLHQLLEGENSIHRQNNQSILSSEQMPQRKYGKIITMQKIAPARKSRPIMRVFSTLVATLIVGVLIGSVLILSHSAHQKNVSTNTTTAAAHHTTTASTVPQGVYTSNGSSVFRLDIQQKQQVIWQQALPDVSKIVSAGKVVYILQSNAVLKLDANTGKILWNHTFSGHDSDEPVTMTLSQNQLYVGWRHLINSQDDGQIDILNASNGDLLPFAYAHTYAETMDVSGSILAVGNTSLHVYNSNTHKLLWQASMTGVGNAFSTVISLKIVNNLIAVVFSSGGETTGAGTSYIVVYEAATGKQIWQSTNFLGAALYHFVIDQNTIYFGSIDPNAQPFTGKVYAYNLQSNQQLWSTTVPGGAQEEFVFSNGMLYTAVDQGAPRSSHLVAINAATGTIKWQQTLDTDVLNSFAFNNGILYTGRYNGLSSDKASLSAFNADSGQKLWEGAQYGNGDLVATN